MARRPLAVAVVAAACLVPISSAAQTSATTAALVGTVRDQTDAVIPGASVTATNIETRTRRAVVTGADGRYAILALPPGVYDIAVDQPGFGTQKAEGAVLALGWVVEIDFVLRVASVSGSVVVVAEPLGLDTQRTAMSGVIAQRQIDALPINGRNFIEFSALTAGVAPDVTPNTGGAAATSGLTFLGQRARSNNITVDGLDNNDIVVGSVRATFSQEAVREFDVLTNGYAAEFGKAAGGVVNIVTRSGTNDVSGSLFYFFRDDALNARHYFETTTPTGAAINRGKAPFGQHQFGGTVGGPIARDRSFYFFSFERLAVATNNFVSIDDQTPVVIGGQPIGTPAGIIRAAGFPIDTGYVPYDVTSNRFLAKIDQQIGLSQSLAVRVNWADDLDENIEPWGGLIARSAGVGIESSDFMVATSHTSVLSAETVNELRGQVAYRDQNVFSLDPTCAGRCDLTDEGGPGAEILGVAIVGRHRFTPQDRTNLRVEVVDTVTQVRGHHQLKAGVDFNFIDHSSQSLPLHFGGRYIFGPLPTIPGVLPAPVSSIQAFALGLPTAYVQGFGNPDGPFPYSDLALFAQDDWRLRPNITVKVGVRYQVQFWPDITTNIPGFGAHRLATDANNLAPRLAASWVLDGAARTTVHAAYGVYYDNNLTSYDGINEVLDGQEGVRTLVLPFPLSIQGWQAPGRRLPESAFGPLPSVVFAVGPGTVTPYSHQANVGVRRDLGHGLVASAAIVYARGFGQVAVLEYNPFLPDLGQFRRPLDVVDPTTGVAIPGSSTSVLQSTSWGETWYKGLALSATQRFREGFEFGVHYTLAEAEDNSTDFQSAFLPDDSGRGRDPLDPDGLPVGFDPASERGPSLHDRRHTFVAHGSLLLPAGVQLGGILSAASGRPYNILAGADLNGDGDGGGPPSDRARGTLADRATTVPRNFGRMPATASVALRVSRPFTLQARVRVEPMLEVFNLFNRTNFTAINSVFGLGSYPSAPLSTYGQFVQAGPPRQVQLAVKVSF